MDDDAVNEIDTVINKNGVRVVEFSLRGKSSGPWHHHTDVTEYCYCLRGQLCIEIDGKKSVLLQPGEKFKIDSNIVHRVRNEVNEDCCFLVIQGVGRYNFVQIEPSHNEGVWTPPAGRD